MKELYPIGEGPKPWIEISPWLQEETVTLATHPLEKADNSRIFSSEKPGYIRQLWSCQVDPIRSACPWLAQIAAEATPGRNSLR